MSLQRECLGLRGLQSWCYCRSSEQEIGWQDHRRHGHCFTQSRAGVVARSQYGLAGTDIAPQDNGVKLVDPRGEMLEASWEVHATTIANAPTTEDFITALEAFVQTTKIDLSRPARVVYARDTRPSGAALISALEDGLKAIGAEGRDAGVITTPILHYLVRSINTKGTKESYGEDSEDGYFQKLSDAFKKLVVSTFDLECIFSISITLSRLVDLSQNH